MKTIKIREITILGILAAIALGGYIWLSSVTFRIGFPLDDAWIHQVYARNLAQTGEWAFSVGENSAGSTAPLWSGILSIGHLLKLPTTAWAFLIGWLLLWAVGTAGYSGFRLLCPSQKTIAILVGIVMIFEWHLVWAAGSGMETLLFALLALVVQLILIQFDDPGGNSRRVIVLLIGILVGISVWVRPDGITLLGPAVFVVLFNRNFKGNRLRSFVYLTLGFGSIFASYLLFNWILAGTFWPNTFYAKQDEYALLQQLPIWKRALDQMYLPLIGVGIILLPGFVFLVYNSIKHRVIGEIAVWMWILGFLMVYAIRLPVIYQHGRYAIPVMPAYFLLGLVGVFSVIDLRSSIALKRVVSRSWALLIGSVLLIFWIVGARAYALDVAIIESEMVAISKWLAMNTDPEDLIAVHDIGAIGYYSDREILDLAGLVSPEVLPIIGDEKALAEFLDQNEAIYLVTFPDWYPYLADQGDIIYISEGEFSQKIGGENMAVYRWRNR